ncbi:MAG: hypothetical protein QM770_15590 [Tepidisphaeraceae bacterium]
MSFAVAKFPASDAGLLTWANHFQGLIAAGPTSYALTTAQSTALTTACTAYQTALNACEKTVRNEAAVITKNDARRDLKVLVRQLVGAINSSTTVTDAQKTTLGLTLRTTPMPVPAPSLAPVVEVASVNAWTVNLRLRAAGSSTSRGKPAGVSGASVFSYVGATPPDEIADWKFEGNTGKSKFDVVFPTTNPGGTKVWLTAFWFNNRKQSGPACAPISTLLQGGGVATLAA